MALPQLECACDVDPCCTSVFCIGRALKDVALEAVNDGGCYNDSCAAPNVDGIVTVGRGDGYEPDMVIVSLLQLATSPRSADQRGNMPGTVLFRAEWQIRLTESGWITFIETDNEPQMLAPDLIEANAAHSYSHAEQMYRAVADAVLTRKVVGCNDRASCFAAVGPLVPLDPGGHTVGWQMTVTLEVDLNGPRHAN